MSAADVNNDVGMHLQQFVSIKETIDHDAASLSGLQLQQPPYNMTPADETDIKTAVLGLKQALDAIDMTFINRLTGLFA